MEKKKRITLNRELIRQLRHSEMRAVIGGMRSPCPGGVDSVPNPTPCNPG